MVRSYFFMIRYDIRHMNDIENDQDKDGMLKSAAESMFLMLNSS
jgi:hypothetical protein